MGNISKQQKRLKNLEKKNSSLEDDKTKE